MMQRICGILLAAWIVLSLSACSHVAPKAQLHEPAVTENSVLPGGTMTEWDCVYFGSYPAREVVNGTFSAVEQYAYDEDDLIVDETLFAALEKAGWAEDETVLDGERYRRLRFQGEESEMARQQHYKWSDGSWHYFRYEPIKWRVVGLDGDSAELMADRLLDCAPYNLSAKDVFWENCTLRSFLNGYDGTCNLEGADYSKKPADSFLGTAFSDMERSCIIKCSSGNPDNYYFGTSCGDVTDDAVYLFAEQEIFHTDAAARRGFALSDATSDAARRFRPTLYAMAKGAWYSPVAGNEGNGFWLVRTCGYTPSNVNYICDFGAVYNRGTFVTVSDAGILPVIRVDTKKADFTYAGKVTSAERYRAGIQDDGPAPHVPSQQAQTGSDTSDLSAPRVESDASLSSGMKTTWDCIYFGSYPTSEVVSGDFDAVKDYAIQPGDVIKDAALVKRLENAEWDGNTAMIDGEAYCRIRLGDTELTADASDQHYQWESADSWHYFKFEPIKWRVIELESSRALLLADRELDCVRYHATAKDVAWEHCTLRSFLNGYDAEMNADRLDYSGRGFLDMAFSEEEQRHILSTALENPDNPYYGTDCGNSTEDKVFILSCEDVFSGPLAAVHGFFPGGGVDDPARRFRPTMYAMARGTWYSPVEAYKGNGFWNMRANGYTLSNASYICDFGYIYSRGTMVTCNDAGVLPALWVNLEGLSVQHAGQVTSG